MIKRLFICALCSFAIHLGAISQPYPAEKITLSGSKLDNFYQIDEGVYRSDQPTKKDFKKLEAFGIVEVLNLRRLHSNEDEAEHTKIKSHRIKTNAHSISEEDIIIALRIINQRKGPILIHCKRGADRTGAVSAMYRIVFQDYSKEQAIEEMREGGFGFFKLYQNIINLIEEADIENIKKEVFQEKKGSLTTSQFSNLKSKSL